MPSAPLPPNEQGRLAALRAYDILDTPPDRHFDDLVVVASYICETPIAIVSLLDADRQWFKAKVGTEVQQTDRSIAFCAHAILDDEILEVPDATVDARFADSSLVTGEQGVRFYAGVPLVTDDQFALGTLCVYDRQPRQLTNAQREALKALGRQVTAMIEAHRANGRLRKLAQMKDEFLRVASHDLKNPLQAIHGASELLTVYADRDGAPRELTELVALIESRAEFMQQIIEDFVDLHAFEDGQLRLEREPCDIGELVRDALAGHASSAAAKELALSSVTVPPIPPVSADHARISQVIENLVGNAIKFSDRGARVFVRVAATPASVRVEVVDQGPGLSADDMANLFARYARLSAKPTAGEGSTGLGLAICRQLIEAHGGQIGAGNNEGAGATFWFEVPV